MLRHPRLFSFLAILLLVGLSRPNNAQQVMPAGFEDAFIAAVPNPTALAFTPDGRILVTTQFGQLYVYQNGALLEAPALDLAPSVCAYRERGLLGVAVDPGFSSNHFIYLSYTFNKFGDCAEEGPSTPVGRVSRFQLSDDNTVNGAGEHVLLDNIPSPIGVHNLDQVTFGTDGYLYVSVGDGACDYAADSGCFDSNDAARDMHALVGKVLRITSAGGIPPDNPFTGPGTVRCNSDGGAEPGSICREIFATGLRNPWRLAFDPNAAATRFFINDVGQDTWEEIDEGRAGADYGWNMREGFCANGSITDCSPTPPPGLTNPVFAYGRDEGCAAVTGGAFVPNGAWPTEFDGAYLFSDFVCGAIFKLVPASDGTFTRETFVTGLGEGSAVDLHFGPYNGGVALYYITFGNGGELRRIDYVGNGNRGPSASFTAAPLFGPTPLTVDFDASASSDPDGDALTYRWEFGDGTPAASGVIVRHTYSAAGAYTPTLRVTDPEGASSTATVRIDVGNTPPQPAILTPTVDARFAVGDTIVLNGRASDSEDGELPDSSLTWRVLLHHNTHTHGFLPPTPGNNIVFRAAGPENLEAAATSYLEVQLTAIDSDGRTATVTQKLMPRTAQLNFLSDPPGATLRIDNGMVATPASFVSWVNFGVAVEAPSQIGPDGPLLFASWSDSGGAAHTIVTPATSASYTAHFAREMGVLPGTIQAEDFDPGDQDVAYHDSSIGNSGGEYRNTDVDIEATTDDGAGYNVGWIAPGEWLKYTVNVTTSGTYMIETRVAASGGGGTFHIEVNGVDKTGPLSIPDTGGWQSWTTVTKTGVSLSAGQQEWRVVFDDVGPGDVVGNMNFIRVTPESGGGGASTPFKGPPVNGVPVALPGTIQAEDFDEGGEGVAYHDESSTNEGGQYRTDTAVDIEATLDAGGGYNVGWIEPHEWANYTVNVTSMGTYTIEVRVASDGAGGTFHIDVNGVDKTGPLIIPDTGGWQSWTTVSTTGVSLSPGEQVWRIVFDDLGPGGIVGNINYIRVTSGEAAAALLLR